MQKTRINNFTETLRYVVRARMHILQTGAWTNDNSIIRPVQLRTICNASDTRKYAEPSVQVGRDLMCSGKHACIHSCYDLWLIYPSQQRANGAGDFRHSATFCGRVPVDQPISGSSAWHTHAPRVGTSCPQRFNRRMGKIHLRRSVLQPSCMMYATLGIEMLWCVHLYFSNCDASVYKIPIRHSCVRFGVSHTLGAWCFGEWWKS